MLRIARLVTRCHAPIGRKDVYSLADSIARMHLATELAAYLGPSLSRQEGVVKIRRLRIRIHLHGRSIPRARLMDAWMRAIGRQLFTALAYPYGGGHFEIERSPSPAHFRAALIRDLLSGSAQGRWLYRSYEAALRLPKSDGIMAALREAPAEIIATLEALADLDSLEAALAILPDIALEEIFRAIAATGATLEAPPDEILGAFVKILKTHAPLRSLRLDSRAQALRLFVLARGQGHRFAPRVWFTALTTLSLLAEHGELWTASPRTPEQICGRHLSPDVAALLAWLRPRLQPGPQSPDSASLAITVESLEACALHPPQAAIAAAEPQPWRELDGASLLLLTAPLVEFGWHAQWRAAAVQPTLYALASAVRGAFDPAVPDVDLNAAFFAGIWGEASPQALRSFYATGLVPADELAAKLVARWTARLPGFRRASQAAIVRQFLTSPGRVRVEETRVIAQLGPNPLFVALRIASLDNPVESVPWFGGRRLEFRIEGL